MFEGHEQIGLFNKDGQQIFKKGNIIYPVLYASWCDKNNEYNIGSECYRVVRSDFTIDYIVQNPTIGYIDSNYEKINDDGTKQTNLSVTTVLLEPGQIISSRTIDNHKSASCVTVLESKDSKTLEKINETAYVSLSAYTDNKYNLVPNRTTRINSADMSEHNKGFRFKSEQVKENKH
jgi:hypothetical protein